ncbi:MAG TPA: Ig-like domain-containing protein [Gemmatimonadales bacterium]|nr:Ig-like domain-containing protein [Gemmatimonadales bacterium]
MKSAVLILVAAGLAVTGACTDTMMGGSTIVSSIIPSGGATDVDPSSPVTVMFSGPMQAGMEAYMALHLGAVAGPAVPGAWAWSDGLTRLTFTPADPLEAGTMYVLHMGGGMMDADGDMLDFGHCGDAHGGQWATGGMMGGNGGMMGSGWQHTNGSYGMVFSFTTR